MSITDLDSASADRVLREVLTGLYVHTACGGIRGRVEFVYSRCGCPVNLGRWQSCPCETHQERWPDADVSSEVDLCLLCARGTAGGTSRWAWVVCSTSRQVEQAAAWTLDVPSLVPAARHSIKNQVAIRAGAPSGEAWAQHAALREWAARSGRLADWQRSEVHRLAQANGWSTATHVELAVWLASNPATPDASTDALGRLLGVDLSSVTSLQPLLTATSRNRQTP